jgi:glutamate-1-semialdehyde 2,1-aminomutase
MTQREKLVAFLTDRYRKRTRRSLASFERAGRVMVGGGSHSVRLFRPYPFIIRKAEGPFVEDLDGRVYVDYWQGHYANVLGHNPDALREKIGRSGEDGDSLHTGFEGEAQIELAERILGLLGWKDHRVRFTTSGTLAAMYAVMLALGWTGRDLILKVAGGWHGASPILLKGVKYGGRGYGQAESAGVPPEFLRKILLVRYNDPDGLERIIRRKGDRIACFIVEPFLGAGGFLAATRPFLETARRLCDAHGILLVFDEIVSGFRFAPTGVQRLYGLEPDLATFGKVIGGGHAVAAVVGKRRILECCEAGPAGGERVMFEGGTFSAHARYMRAGTAALRVLAGRAKTIYPRLAGMGETLRRGIEAAFAAEEFDVRCTGGPGGAIGGSSLFMVNFPKKTHPFASAEDVWDPRLCDIELKEGILKLAMATLGVHVVHGGGAVSAAHDGALIGRTIEAYAEAARIFGRFLRR